MWPASAWVSARRSAERRSFSGGRVKAQPGAKCWKSSRHSWTSTQLPAKRPSGWSIEVSRATVRVPARSPVSTMRRASNCASAVRDMKAPEPVLTSRTRALRPAASFLLMMLAVMR